MIRLTEKEIALIKAIFTKYFRKDDKLWLFGSRIDMHKKGGDIDLYIETTVPDYDLAIDTQMAFIIELKKNIGDQKIDVVLNLLSSPYILPIYKIAHEGVQLICMRNYLGFFRKMVVIQ